MSDPSLPRRDIDPPRAPVVPPPVPSPVTVDAGPRYQVRTVEWGDRRRFEVRDTLADKVLAIRTTRISAEDDLMVLKMSVRGLSGVGTAPTPAPVAQTRRCGRCRGLFPADPHREPSAVEEWWLCGPCHEVLIGPSHALSSTLTERAAQAAPTLTVPPVAAAG